MNEPQNGLDAAIVLVREGKLTQAEVVLRQLIKQFPEHPMPNHLMGIVFYQSGFPAKAEKFMRQAISLAPGFVPARSNLASVLLSMKRMKEAKQLLEEVIQIQPGYVDAYCNLAALHIEESDNDAASRVLDEGLMRAPNHTNLLNLKSIVLRRKGDVVQALVALERILRLEPAHFEALLNAGRLALQVGNNEFAVKALESCLVRSPSNTGLLVDLARAHLALEHIDQALLYCKRALELSPEDVACLYQYGFVLARDGQHQAAEHYYQKALDIDPGHLSALESRLFLTNYLASINPQEAYEAHVVWAQRFTAELPVLNRRVDIRCIGSDDKITIGFVSADFCLHPISFFFLPLARHFDKSRFRFVCYLNRHKEDELSGLLTSLVDQFENIANLNDEAFIQKIHQDKIDILVDMSGHTANHRLAVFAQKPAAMQVSWLAYPNTTGLVEIDYRLTDPLVEPPESQALSTERLLYLDQGFLCFELVEPIVSESRQQQAEGQITFGCFNNFRKINDELMALWAEILQNVTGSRLVLKYDQLSNPSTRERVLRKFADFGVSSDRVVLVGRLESYREHLAYYQNIDIALDTYPYNGTTTTLEALNMGVPVITLSGNRHASRVGMAILSRLGLSDLVASSPDEYVQRARVLAQDASRLKHLHATLGEQVRTSHLMQGQAFASAFERLMRETYQRHGLSSSLPLTP